MKKIIFATDYSAASQAALPFATWLARQGGATLLIVHVSQREQYPVGELFDEEATPNEEELKALHAVVPDDPQVKCEHHLLYGPAGSAETVHPADVLLGFAGQQQPDAIVLGTHGRKGWSHLLMGSVAELVLRNAKCPVVLVKQP